MKSLRADLSQAEDQMRTADSGLSAIRRSQTEAETEREQLQAAIQGGHREHSDARSKLEAARARAQELQSRRARLEHEAADVARETATAHESVGVPVQRRP